MTAVVDASAIVAALVDDGPDGDWAEAQVGTEDLVAPHLMPVEVANILRRTVRAGRLSADTAALAHSDHLRLAVALFPYEPYAQRVWQLRDQMTAYDAWYVALAESFDVPLITLDRRLPAAQDARCRFRLPP